MNILEQYLNHLDIKRNTQQESGKTEMVFRVSGLPMCERRQVYNALGFEKKQSGDVEGEFTLNVCTAIHELIQDQLMSAGIIKEMRDKSGNPTEVEIKIPELRISGHCDGQYFTENGDLGIFEFKTSNNIGFASTVRYNKGKPTKKHAEQVNFYAGALNAKEWSVLVWNKNGIVPSEHEEYFKENNLNQHFAIYTLPFNQELFVLSIEKLKRMHKYVDEYEETKKLPNKVSDRQCGYCNMLWQCKPKKYAEVESGVVANHKEEKKQATANNVLKNYHF